MLSMKVVPVAAGDHFAPCSLQTTTLKRARRLSLCAPTQDRPPIGAFYQRDSKCIDPRILALSWLRDVFLRFGFLFRRQLPAAWLPSHLNAFGTFMTCIQPFLSHSTKAC